MAEFLITTDLSPINGLQIEANFDEMEKELTELMTPYKSLVVTDVKAAKDARAYCNKVKKALDESRKQVKKLWISPYTVFEDKVKHLTSICDEAAGAIDAQVKAIEEADKTERKKKIEDYFSSQVGDELKPFVSLEDIWDDKWLNKTADAKQCAKAIGEYISHVVNDLCAIEALGEEHRDVLRREYSKTHSMTAVNDLYAFLVQKGKTTHGAEENLTEANADTLKSKQGKLHQFTLEFTCTVAEAKAINEFFANNHIQFRRVK